MNTRISIILFAVTLTSIPWSSPRPVPITADNFIRAESDSINSTSPTKSKKGPYSFFS